ncbi:MAG: hypothetical protein JNK99_00235 [Candidatus Accumulibacter sp.]|uniref:hypothetical protein n=1 Tax=Accumulibacter sp. TaxID=2053492 RepID=UPI001A432DF2|nr:hypothetical protein [Accumulibacter sp.]MBL8393164.1 hypothetical protein [Accumulibacter sp.]
MRLEDIAIGLRRRSAWEAIDLGHAMLRQWAPRVYGAWFATYWSFGLLLMLLLWPWPEYVMLLLWWLKPLFDRVLLHVFSRSVFGEACSVRAVLRELPRLWRGPGVVSGLTLRRFSLARALLLPVWQLEEQHGATARARFRLLSRRCRGHAVWLTFFCTNMSSILLVSLLVLLLALVPGDHQDLSLWEWFGGDRSNGQYLLSNLLFMSAETVIEPLYVASGFSLYLNRRSELEGWDIEVGLRRLAERLAGGIVVAPVFAVLGWAAVVMLWLPAAPAQAAVPSSVAAAESRPPPVAGSGAASGTALSTSATRLAVDEVLADPVFGQSKDDWRWHWRQEEAPAGDDGRNWFVLLMRLTELLAEVLRGLLWVLVGLVLAGATHLVIRYRQKRAAALPRTAPEFLSGLDLRPDSLPTDIAAAAAAALAGGNTVEALSLLYRGALVRLIQQRQIEFAVGDTEKDCLLRVAGQVPAEVDHCFGEVVHAWCLVAYGGQAFPGERTAALLADWGRHFDHRVSSS